MRDRLRDLQAQTATEQRRLVTILFADLVDFTVLTRRLDAEDVRELVNDYFTRWTSAIERHNGVVEKFAGDAVMAVFGLLQSTDLDPIQAVRAALAMGRELELLNARLEPQYGVRLQMRTGIHTGHAIVSTLRERRGQDFVIVGDSVNLASRLQALAPSQRRRRFARHLPACQPPVRAAGFSTGARQGLRTADRILRRDSGTFPCSARPRQRQRAGPAHRP